MRFLFFALLFFMGQMLVAQQDSLPLPKKVDSVKVAEIDSLGVIKKDSIVLDSLAKDSLKSKKLKPIHPKDKKAAKQDSLPLPKRLDSVKVAEIDSLGVIKKDSIVLDSVAKDTLKPKKLKPLHPKGKKGEKQDSLSPPKKLKPKGPPKKKEKKQDSISVRDYKIISYARDTIFLDTTLTIQKEYKYNYIREDDFELMPFANMGQPYNVLGRTFSKNSYYPKLGATAKHANYFEVEDIKYYNVPTPMTDLMFKTTMEQGQMLDALLTFNVSRRFNMSLAFKGFRSLGKYRFEQAESGNFRTTFNYSSANNRYLLRGHIAAQDIESEENGGIANREQFEDDPEGDFEDRFRLDVRYTNANNRILGKRYFLDQQFKLVNSKRDSLDKNPTTLTIGHEFNYETKFYDFTQSAQDDAFGDDPFLTPIEDRARLKTMYNKGAVEFSNKLLGRLSGSVGLYNYNYFFNSLLITDEGTIQNKLEGEEIVVGGAYSKKIGRLFIDGNVDYTVSGELTGNRFDAMANYQVNENNSVLGSIHVSSRMPDFNFLLYQSDYRNYNWQNSETFEKQQVQSIKFAFNSKFIGLLEAEYSAIDNYTYFASNATQEQIDAGQETAFIKPFQETSTINHLRVKYTKEFKWRKWALANTVLYQEITQDNQVLNLPQVLTRNTLYFSSDVFKKAMFLQTGVNFKYFTSYNMNAYNPLLGEFYIQNNEEFGAYPLLDVFINAKVRQTRIYLKAEHLNSIFSEPKYYSAPNYPYRDFVIRFGLVWNFFS
ncbi:MULTISPECIES: putative porin [Flavobacteriaceae]|uniref:putative porin n=1 Tax=Flavobacteriaceae TaxID=49546 RepID=UPI001FEAF786|nr:MULTISPECIES: putative porin [Allomuricauda]MDC6365730.1 putative porin [Muricauda sp. AC10]